MNILDQIIAQKQKKIADDGRVKKNRKKEETI